MVIDSKRGPGPLGRRIERGQLKEALSNLRNFFANNRNWIENLKEGLSLNWQILGDLQKESLRFLIQKHPEILDGLTK